MIEADVIFAHPDKYSSLMCGQLSANDITHLSVRLCIPATANIFNLVQYILNSHILASVRSQFLKLHFVSLGQLWANDITISSVICLTPANKSISKFGQLVVII